MGRGHQGQQGTGMQDSYDIVLVGSGFSSQLFLRKALQFSPAKRILVLERGADRSWEWQVRNQRNEAPAYAYGRAVELSGMEGKSWPHTIGLGGSSNCWWANTMRFLPSDLKLRSTYGVGVDWPVSYDELEPYYTEFEEIMAVSGDDESAALFPRSKPFPQKRHRFSRVARAFKTAHPDHYFAMPQARARVATGRRNPCCSNSMCGLCPNNAKYTLVEDMDWLRSDARVELRTETEVKEILVEAGKATGVACVGPKGPYEVRADMVVLAANGIYNPFILLKSGIDQGPVGKGLTEQIPVYVLLNLDGLDDGDGSSHITGVGYNFALGAFRQHAAGGFYETSNLPRYRPHPERWRQRLNITILLDDLRQDRNFVGISREDPDKPLVHFEDWSPYAHAGLKHVRDNIDALLGHLPIEEMEVRYGTPSGHGHIEGTTVMGSDPGSSVVDPDLVHHKVRNLVVLGAGAFPTAGGVNPTLTVGALALRSATRLFGAAAA